ncbi:hypothetical protein IKG48_01380 [Candidatus Saccharibacteria bacterium]|nr:hypothetical protein [Candidatus Saccharibacteria bacterium]
MEANNTFYRKRRLYLTLIIISVIFFISIPIIIFLLTKKPTVTISNLTEIKTTSIEKPDEQRIENSLLTVLSYLDNLNGINIDDAYIRPESYEEKTTDGITEISFLVDIDSQKITYRVNLYTSKDNSNYSEDVVITCPNYNETKYPKTPCYGMEGDSTTPVPYFPYENTIEGHPFSVNLRYDFYDSPTLEITFLDYCPNSELIEKVENTIYDWVKNDLDLDPNEYILYTTSDSC